MSSPNLELILGEFKILWITPEFMGFHCSFRAVSVLVEGLGSHGLISSIDSDSFIAYVIIGQPFASSNIGDFIIASLLESGNSCELSSWLPDIFLEVSHCHGVEWVLVGIVQSNDRWHIFEIYGLLALEEQITI